MILAHLPHVKLILIVRDPIGGNMDKYKKDYD